MNLILSMFWFGLKCTKNFISSYSLPFGLSHGTRRTNLSPQDQAKYKLSSDQAHVHVSSPGLCALVSPFTGFSSSTTPTSSTNKIKLTSAWTKKITWSDMYHEKKNQSKIKLFLPTTQEFIVFGNSHTCIISSKFSFMRPRSVQGTIFFDITIPLFPYICNSFRLSIYLMATIEIMTNK